jgi:hypothetical protein
MTSPDDDEKEDEERQTQIDEMICELALMFGVDLKKSAPNYPFRRREIE